MMPAVSYTSQIWSHVAAALVVALLAVYTWPRRCVRGGRPFFVCQLVLFLLFLFEILISTANTLLLKTIFYQAWAVLALWSCLLALWLAIDYAGLIKRVSYWNWMLPALPLTVFSGLMMTNSAHGWAWSRFWDDGRLRSTLGIAGVVGSLYGFILAFVCLIIIVMVAWRAHGVLRWQAGLLALGGVIVCVGVVPEIIRSDITPRPALSSVLCTVGLLVAAVALFYFRAFDLAPILRHTLVEQMGHGMMVLDAKQRVVDLNPAAKRLLEAASWQTIGQEARDVLRAWPALLRAVYDADEATHTEVTMTDGQNERIFDVSVSPLPDSAGGRVAKLLLWCDATEMRLAQAELERQRSAFAALAERERVGRELHDGLAQMLGCVKLQAQAAHDAIKRDCPAEASAELASILAITQQAHEEVRDFLLGARMTIRPGGNFWSTIADCAKRYSAFYSLKVTVSIPPDISDLTIDSESQVHLLRIIQESLANVHRHAGVSTASLTFTRANGHLCVTVHDDGLGFDPAAAPGHADGHCGLSFMRARAEEVGGRLDVTSTPGQGTDVLLQVPLARKDRPDAPAIGG